MEQAALIFKDLGRTDSDLGPRSLLALSVVVPVSERHDDLGDLYLQYEQSIRATGLPHEFIFVLDGPNDEALRALTALKRKHPDVTVVALHRWFGEATALSVGFAKARAPVVLTLASYFQVEPSELRRVLTHLAEEDHDLVIAWRHPRIDSPFNRLQSKIFHWLVRGLTGTRYHDISCGLRAMKRTVAEQIHLYGDLHRFLPLLAEQHGFKVAELAVKQSRRDTGRRVYRPGLYLRRLLDILTLFFLFKFTKKPLRFFGLCGSGIFGMGATITAYLGLYRLLGLGPLADRPLLILGVLLMVLGVQLFSVGLLGEIIIFTHARDVRDYEVSEILE